jgi:hypothetical protein
MPKIVYEVYTIAQTHEEALELARVLSTISNGSVGIRERNPDAVPV